MTSVLILSDVHLPPSPSPLRKTFRDFLDGPARTASAVYILGDLFDVWVGDDIGLRDHADECAALRRLTGTGVPVRFQHGNRDFLIGDRFASATGVELIADPAIVDLPDGPALLSHGDLFCTDDHRYQRYRRVMHARWLQRLLLALPKGVRRWIGRRLRASSESSKARTDAGIMDVNLATVVDALDNAQQTRAIHGHTHRPAEHPIETEQGKGTRLVLADWRADRMEYLSCDASGWQRVNLAGAAR